MDSESDAVFGGEIEVDESHFGGKRKGKRGRGAAGKVPVFGLLKRKGKVYTKIIPDARSATLMPIIEQKVFRTALFILTVGMVTTCWMCPSSDTIASTIQNALQTTKTISMALRTLGIRQSVICGNSMVFQRSIFRYF